MSRLTSILMYLYIFGPSARGVETTYAKAWFKKMNRDKKKNNKYSMSEKKFAYKHGCLPEHIAKFGTPDLSSDDYISEREYLYLQPINSTYSKWLMNNEVISKVFRPFREYLDLSSDDKGGASGVLITENQAKSFRNRLPSALLDDEDFQPDTGIQPVFGSTLNKPGSSEDSATHDAARRAGASGRSAGRTGASGNAAAGSGASSRAAGDRGASGKAAARSGASGESAEGSGARILRLIITNEKGYDPEITECYDPVTGEKGKITEEIRTVITDMAKFTPQLSFYSIDIRVDDAEALMQTLPPDPSDEAEGGSWNAKGPDRSNETEGVEGNAESVADNNTSHAPADSDASGSGAPADAGASETTALTGEEQTEPHAPGFKCIRFQNFPEYPKNFLFSPKTARFLNKKRKERRQHAKDTHWWFANARKHVHFKLRQGFAVTLFPDGMLPYLCTRWMKEVCIDFFSKTGVSLKDKLWAYKHGFLSYRLPQYGITRENHTDFISDYEYKYLRHINGDYRILFEDKITIKYILNEFNECFPGYYYHIKTDSEGNVIIPMMDCPKDYGRDYQDILKLARERGVLALKPDVGSHGDGFYKLAWVEEGFSGYYTLNDEKASEEKIIGILSDIENQYLVTEYINNHPQFKEIYAGAVNTIRMIVFKEPDGTPVLGNVYMRFGSKQTGAVDNMGAGGMFVQVDKDTGWYHNAKIIRHNSIEPCPNHPDTGVLMEGYIPNYEYVKSKVLEIAASVEQMEYFGFDVAITAEGGIKFPEINRFPDYPKIETLSPITMNYLLRKLSEKKYLFGYGRKKCHKLFGFPER